MTLSTKKRKHLPIVDIAIGGIALGMFVMLLAIFISSGYRTAVNSKILGFVGHIDLINYDSNLSYQTSPIDSASVYKITKDVVGIKKIMPYAVLGGIATTNEETEAVVLKGVNQNFDWSFLKKNIIEGTVPHIEKEKRSNEVLISETLAKKLKLNVGDKLYTHFLQNPPRSRVFNITGIYNTGIAEFDNIFVMVDLRHTQRLYQWESSQYSGVSLLLEDFDTLEQTTAQLSANASANYDKQNPLLRVANVKRTYSHIFDWLNMMSVNTKIILFLIILVSAFNMISALLVIILEKTRHIGVLKSLGMPNKQVRKIFLYKATYIIVRGMLLGNIMGFIFAFLQQKYQWIALDPNSYFLNALPIKIDVPIWIILNVSVLAITILIMLIPTTIITKISPAKVIRFE